MRTMDIHGLNSRWVGWTAEERELIVKAQTPCPRGWFREIQGRK